MTVTQLRDPVVVDALGAASSQVEIAAGVPPGSLNEDELAQAVSLAARLEAQAASLKLSLLGEADSREVAKRTAETGTDAWASRLTGSTQAVMRGGIWLAQMLAERYHFTRDAFRDGGINEAQARVIVKAAEKMPAAASEDERRAAEASLVAKAVEGMNPRGLRQAARRMLAKVNAELADQQEASMLEQETTRAERETYAHIWDNGDGTYSGKFRLPELHGSLLRGFLERLTSPRRLGRNKAGRVVLDESVEGGYEGMNWHEKMGFGLRELIEHLPVDGFAEASASLLVKVDFTHLLDGLAGASVDTGTRIGIEEARRLGCAAGIIPAVFDGPSARLDLGREQRLFTPAQRRALALRYDTCGVEGCERPFAWCDIHHKLWWSRWGPTDLDNAIPLCGYHHVRAHDDAFNLKILPSGEAKFTRRRR
ncbi:MAG TPA: DUF222 domain-containing protein [Nocardioidaceae bacterium]|nr:DUF222 domain-containing protein [Nocardioidaceae bacterium]